MPTMLALDLFLCQKMASFLGQSLTLEASRGSFLERDTSLTSAKPIPTARRTPGFPAAQELVWGDCSVRLGSQEPCAQHCASGRRIELRELCYRCVKAGITIVATSIEPVPQAIARRAAALPATTHQRCHLQAPP